MCSKNVYCLNCKYYRFPFGSTSKYKYFLKTEDGSNNIQDIDSIGHTIDKDKRVVDMCVKNFRKEFESVWNYRGIDKVCTYFFEDPHQKNFINKCEDYKRGNLFRRFINRLFEISLP